MWLCLCIIVPFEYLKYQHPSAFICQDYSLHKSNYLTVSRLRCQPQSPIWHRNKIRINGYQLSQTGNLWELICTMNCQCHHSRRLGQSLRKTLSLLPEGTPCLTFIIQPSLGVICITAFSLLIREHFIPLLVYPKDGRPAC